MNFPHPDFLNFTHLHENSTRKKTKLFFIWKICGEVEKIQFCEFHSQYHSWINCLSYSARTVKWLVYFVDCEDLQEWKTILSTSSLKIKVRSSVAEFEESPKSFNINWSENIFSRWFSLVIAPLSLFVLPDKQIVNIQHGRRTIDFKSSYLFDFLHLRLITTQGEGQKKRKKSGFMAESGR